MAGVLPEEGDDLESIELQLLLEGIYRRYSFDFREYAPGPIRRRLLRRLAGEGLPTLSALQERVLRDPACMERLLGDLSVNVTAMFRDPSFYRAFRTKVIPVLRTYPFIRIWNAGCSTGEEAYSIAVLLHEAGLYDRSRIYATDINEAVLQKARAGIFPLEILPKYADNYRKAGGEREFSEYFVTGYDSARYQQSLAANIVFARHNLVSDASFNEFNVIMCRNVLIYFARSLQERVHGLFHQSLSRLGVLALGQKETLRFMPHEGCYEELDPQEKLYRRVR